MPEWVVIIGLIVGGGGMVLLGRLGARAIERRMKPKMPWGWRAYWTERFWNDKWK